MSEPERQRRYPAIFNDITWYRSNVPCMQACPVHTDSGRYVQLIGEGRYLEAFLVARSPNPLASICGRICAAPCEDACRRNWTDEAVTIRSLKRFVTERHGAESARPDDYLSLKGDIADPGCSRPWHLSHLSSGASQRSGKVAVVGSGPSGLACAHDLVLMGYQVTIFEALPLAGGMMRYGIPEYRLPRGVIDREIAVIQDLGAEIRTGVAVDASHNLQALRDEGYSAIYLGVGAMRGRELDITGHEKDGVVKAVDYLLNLNRGYRVDLGEKVVVIGGGLVGLDAARSAVREFYKPMDEIEMTAEATASQPVMDAARGALRGGAKEVHVVSLESMDELPSSRTVQGQEELREATAEGIVFHPSRGPREILGDGRVTGIDLVECTRVFDKDGRFSPQFNDSNILKLEADAVILAIGQQPDTEFLTEADGVELGRGGTIKIDPETLATTAAGVYAGGDAAFGPRIVIEAVANGKRAAESINRYLGEKGSESAITVQIQKVPTADYEMRPGYEKEKRRESETVSVDRRTGITEVEEAFEETEAKRQAERCLACHVETIYDAAKCVLCGRCADVCPEKCLVFVPIDQVDMPASQRQAALEHYAHGEGIPLTALLKDDTDCIRCGLCAVRCPTDAMTMERFNYVETES
jgi:formate dehydrogenase (NADP+) beta subunit